MVRQNLIGKLRLAAVVVVGIALVAIIGWTLRALFKAEAPSQRRAQQITLVRPHVPPPPKPPEKPPEPPKREEVKVEPPKPADTPKASDDAAPKSLGLDAEGSGAGDGFGLGANKGGRDITTVTPQSGGRGTGMQRSVYTDALQKHIQQVLARQNAMRLVDHRTYVDIWIDRNGAIQRAELGGTTAVTDPAVVRALETALAALAGTALRETPPEGLAMPIRVRLLNRGAS